MIIEINYDKPIKIIDKLNKNLYNLLIFKKYWFILIYCN